MLAKMAGAVWLSLLIAAGGCTAVEHTKAMRAERELSASGFQLESWHVRRAEGAGREASAARARPRPVRRQRRYVYADAAFCECIYAGTEGAFQRFRGAVAEDIQRQALADSMLLDPPIDASTAERNEALASKTILAPSGGASLDWESWGPWGPWY